MNTLMLSVMPCVLVEWPPDSISGYLLGHPSHMSHISCTSIHKIYLLPKLAKDGLANHLPDPATLFSKVWQKSDKDQQYYFATTVNLQIFAIHIFALIFIFCAVQQIIVNHEFNISNFSFFPQQWKFLDLRYWQNNKNMPKLEIGWCRQMT